MCTLALLHGPQHSGSIEGVGWFARRVGQDGRLCSRHLVWVASNLDEPLPAGLLGNLDHNVSAHDSRGNALPVEEP